MLKINKARYVKDYNIEIEFNDGKCAAVDLKELVFQSQISVFIPLRDMETFKQFKVDYTLCWGENIDIAPEFLYFLAFQSDPALQDQFKKWGYAA